MDDERSAQHKGHPQAGQPLVYRIARSAVRARTPHPRAARGSGRGVPDERDPERAACMTLLERAIITNIQERAGS